jgi:hypothetical protein
MSVVVCDRCSEPFSEEDKGLDDEHCQCCWEAICAGSWWEMLRSLEGDHAESSEGSSVALE